MASFIAQGSGCTFTFYDSSYTANGPMTYAWDFGDGSTGTGANLTHTFATGGVYNVCLTIADSQGCTDTYCQTVTATCGGGGGGCAASYFWYPDTTGQYTIIIVNTSTGSNLSYVWDFGDGSTSTQANPSHVYNGPSNYVVCVTVIDSTPGNTCVSTFCDTIAVLNRMNVPFSINVINGTVGVDQQIDNVVGMQIAPNPAKDRAELHFSLNQAENTRVQLMDIQGRVVKQLELGNLSSGAQQSELDLSGLKSGMYMVNIVAGQQRFTKKLIISE
jgi:PKD repeat protein